jgi:hypothetical protein
MIIKGSANHTLKLIILLVTIGLAALVFGKISFTSFIIAEMVIITITFIFSGLRLFYYKIDEKSITVKNIFYWWYEREITLQSIKKVKVYQRADGNKIIIIDSKRFISNNLSKDDITKFIDILEAKGIAIEFPC